MDEISPLCDGIHVTDSVLGTRRVPAVLMARRIKERHQNLQVTASMRVRDRNMQRIEELVEEYASAGIDGVLVLMGDPSQDGRADLGLVPSSVAGSLVRSRYEKKIAFYLSLPANPNFSKDPKKDRCRAGGLCDTGDPLGGSGGVGMPQAEAAGIQDHSVHPSALREERALGRVPRA